MYKVVRTGGKVVIIDWNGKTIYSADPTDLVVYEGAIGEPTTDEVGKLNDSQLLLALTKAIKLPF
jgi:hypothetical protein